MFPLKEKYACFVQFQIFMIVIVFLFYRPALEKIILKMITNNTGIQ